MNEIYEPELVQEVIKASLKLTIDMLGGVGKKITNAIAIERAMSQYAEAYLNRHAHIKILGMSRPMSLFKLYTDVEIINPIKRERYESIEELEYLYRNSKEKYIETSLNSNTRMNGIELANHEQYLNVLGPPWSGKTTFLRRIGLEAMLPKKRWSDNILMDTKYLSKYEHDLIPIYIELRRFKTEEIDLISLIKNEFIICGFPKIDEFIEKALKKGHLLILLDGLDEVPAGKLNEVIDHIQDFTDKYRKNRFITSCRMAFYKTYFSKFVDVEIAEFNNEQIETFVGNWFFEEDQVKSFIVENLLSQLFNKIQSSTLELARTPLLLTFICLVFDETQKLPNNRSNLYSKAIMILLERWSAQKRVHNDPIFDSLHPELEFDMLASISAIAFENNKIFFTKDELLQSIREYLEESLGETKNIDSRKALIAIEIHQGLLVQRAEGVYSFSHLTIQEYLTAYYFHAPGRIQWVTRSYLFDPKWREIFLLMSGMSQPDATLLAIIESLNMKISESKLLKDIIKWVNSVTIQIDDLQVAFCYRLFILCLPLRFKRPDTTNGKYVKEILNDADNLIYSLGCKKLGSYKWKNQLTLKSCNRFFTFLSYSQIFKIGIEHVGNEIIKIGNLPKGAMYGTRYRYVKYYLAPLFQTLGLDENYHDIKPSEAKSILNYISGCLMIFDCKDSALRLSKHTWEKILSKMIVFK